MADGYDCTCAAHSENECCCGADWTPQETYDLRDQLAASKQREAELLAEIDRKMSAAEFIIQHNKELATHVERLRKALERMRVAGGSQEFHMAWELAKDLLAATPEQSLARVRNQYPYPIFPADVPEPTGGPVIRAMKKPEREQP